MKNEQREARWLSQVESARSPTDLVRVVHEYMAALSAEERAVMPAGFTPENIARASDIQEWAVTLAHADLKGDAMDGAARTLREAAIVFGSAGAKLPKLADGG